MRRNAAWGGPRARPLTLWPGALLLVMLLAGCAAGPASTPRVSLPAAPTVTPRLDLTPGPAQPLPYPDASPAGSSATPAWVVLPDGTLQTPDAAVEGLSERVTYPTAAAPGETPVTADCTAVFPLDAVGRISSGSLTIEQVIAAFGPLVGVSGRPPVYRFEADGCTLRVTGGARYAESAEISPYFRLADLAACCGAPEAAAHVPAASAENIASLRSLGPERLALIYPARGMAALFAAEAAGLDSPALTLLIGPAGTLEEWLARLPAGAEVLPGWTLPGPVRN